MLANFLIGLREGLEAALVVGILAAYLIKTRNADRLPSLWAGVIAAVGLSLGVGALLTFSSATMSFEAREAFGGFMSLVAVGFVTWMVFWMRRTARTIKSDLEGKLQSALSMGTFALVAMAFVAVAREGLETSVFIWAAVQSTGQSTAPVAGAALGLLTAVFLGWLIYRRAVRINLATFFKVTGIGLVVVAAGVLAYGIHDLQEARLLPGLDSHAFDISSTIPITSWYGSLLKGTFNFNPTPTWLELGAWLAYLVPVLAVFLWPQRARVRPPASAPAARVQS
jgi:high-affinity iron transporter